MMLLNSHVTCSCIFHAYVLSFLSYSELVSLSLSLSLSLTHTDRLHYSTQIVQIHSGSEPSSRFRVFFFQSSHVPRVAHPDYLGCDRLQIVSRDELISHFCETPSTYGGKLNTSRSSFAKGPRFLNIVMTFTLTPLSHYNSITEPRARFLLSLLEDLSIDFPSHPITSIIDIYQDTTTRDKLIFPLAIKQTLQFFHIPISFSPLFTTICAISVGFVRRSEA